MKILFLTSLALFLSGIAFSQESDARLFPHFSTMEVEEMKAKHPEKYEMIVYALDNGMYLADVPNEKRVNFPTLILDIDNMPTFLELGLEIKKENQYFRVDGEKKIVVLKSEWVLNHEMKKL